MVEVASDDDDEHDNGRLAHRANEIMKTNLASQKEDKH